MQKSSLAAMDICQSNSKGHNQRYATGSKPQLTIDEVVKKVVFKKNNDQRKPNRNNITTKIRKQTSALDDVEAFSTSILCHNFPQRLCYLLDDTSNSSTIRWLSHGKSFKVFDIKDFEENMYPLYFGQKCKYWSFTRKLGRWGFVRITTGPESGSYYHPMFQRDAPDLIYNMKFVNRQSRSFTTGQTSLSEGRKSFTSKVPEDNVCAQLHVHDFLPNKADVIATGFATKFETVTSNDTQVYLKNSPFDFRTSPHSVTNLNNDNLYKHLNTCTHDAITNEKHRLALNTTIRNSIPVLAQHNNNQVIEKEIMPGYSCLTQHLESNNPISFTNSSVHRDLLAVKFAIDNERQKLFSVRMQNVVREMYLRQALLETTHKLNSGFGLRLKGMP